jgi:lipopolysaccharide transport system permease protein
MVMLGLSLFQPSLLANLLFYGLPGTINFLLFMFWLPLFICLLGARFKDVYQLVPIILQLVFLLSPILYRKTNLGSFQWIAAFNPLYQAFSPLRDSLILGKFAFIPNTTQFLINVVGIYLSLKLLQKERKMLPFLV